MSTPSLSPTRSSSPSPTPSTSRINLPPNTLDSSSFLGGGAPNVLADRVLGLHSKAPSSRPGIARGASLLEVLRAGKAGPEERTPLLGDQEDEADEEEEEEGQRRVRSARSRSKSLRRKLKWHERPSPIWFIPGTLVMSLSIGMIISPKIEIYTQLVCRALGPKSGTALPPPPNSFGSLHTSPWAAGGGLQLPEDDGEVPRFVDRVRGNVIEWEEVEGDTWSKQCRRSSEVQKSVASLATTLTLVMGILSALTTGYWGSLSDRRGRKPILALALLGTVFMDSIFLIVVNYHEIVGYRFLIVGPAFDGLLGGMSTATAATNAYLSDCTDAGSRARIFAVVGGLLYGGVALGPVFGAFLIRLTGSVLTPFYVALTMHVVYLFFILVIFPESLSIVRQLEARKRHWEEVEERKEGERGAFEGAEGWRAVLGIWARMVVAKAFWFLKPLALLLPKKRGEEKEEDRPVIESRGRKMGGRSWELTKIAVAYGGYMICMAVLGVKILYTGYKFSWGPQENGYYLSFIGGTRVFVLIVALPLLIKAFRKPAPVPATARPESDLIELDGASSSSKLSKEQKEWEEEAKYLRVVHDSHFDLLLARSSIFIDIIGYIILALNGGSPTLFLFATAIEALGGGASPAIQSLALALASPRDAGRLFASLSVLQSLGAQVLGPILFGVVYFKSVDKRVDLPELMFWFAVGLFSISLAAMMCVRLKGRIVDGEAVVDGVVVNGEGERRRGRSTTRKTGTSSAGESGFTLREDS